MDGLIRQITAQNPILMRRCDPRRRDANVEGTKLVKSNLRDVRDVEATKLVKSNLRNVRDWSVY